MFRPQSLPLIFGVLRASFIEFDLRAYQLSASEISYDDLLILHQ